MTNRAIFSGFAVVLTFALGCTGELVPFDPLVDNSGTPPAVGDPLAQQVFSTDVQPILNIQRARGACAACHQADLAGTGPFFMGASASDNFTSVLSYPNLVAPGSPTTSRLQNYGAHTGDALLPEESDIISTWIMML